MVVDAFSRRFLFAAAALIALSALSACGTSDGATKPDGPVIKSIDIVGAKELKEGEIKKKILTSETPWYAFLPFVDKERLDPNNWQADLRRIERYYEANGYYQAQVLEDRIIPEGDEVRLKVKVHEGEQTLIDKLEIDGLENLPKDVRDATLKDLPAGYKPRVYEAKNFKPGTVPFKEDEWAGVKGQIVSVLKEKGYAEAAVTGEVAVDIATKKATVSVHVVPGKHYKFGNVFVAGGARPKVKNADVLTVVRPVIVKDAPYQESKLATAQDQVFKMGVFGGVKVNRGAPDREAGTVPIVVDVREAPFHTVKAGVGAGVDQARNEVRVTGEYTDRNFLGDLRRLTARAKIGYAFIPSAYAVSISEGGSTSGLIVDSVLEFEQPRIFQKWISDLKFQAQLGFEKAIEPAYDDIGGRLKLGVIWEPGWLLKGLSIFPSYNLEAHSLTGQAELTDTAPSLIFGACPEIPPPAPGEKPLPCRILLSYLSQVVELDRRNDKLEPKSGYYAALTLQEAGLGGTYRYVKILPEVRGYYSVRDDKITFAAKLKLGTMLAANADQTPITERFFSGGSNSNRGFNNRRLSPLQYIEHGEKRLGELIPVGGSGLVEGSAELRYNLTKAAIFAVFLDTGTVTRASLHGSAFGPDHMNYAFGLGFRYLTPVGPIRVDVARRFDIGAPLEVLGAPAGEQPWPTDGGCFGLFAPSGAQAHTYGGSPEGQCTLHLSIGEAF